MPQPHHRNRADHVRHPPVQNGKTSEKGGAHDARRATDLRRDVLPQRDDIFLSASESSDAVDLTAAVARSAHRTTALLVQPRLRGRRRIRTALGLLAVGLLLTPGWAGLGSLLIVSGPSPFATGCEGTPQQGTVYPNAEVEPWVEVNPTNPNNIIAVLTSP